MSGASTAAGTLDARFIVAFRAEGGQHFFGSRINTSTQSAALTTNLPFQFHKRSQLLIRSHNETLPIVAMRVNNPDCSPLRINRCHPAPAPSGLRILAQLRRELAGFKLAAHLLIFASK
jgi:hypothetical protein